MSPWPWRRSSQCNGPGSCRSSWYDSGRRRWSAAPTRASRHRSRNGRTVPPTARTRRTGRPAPAPVRRTGTPRSGRPRRLPPGLVSARRVLAGTPAHAAGRSGRTGGGISSSRVNRAISAGAGDRPPSADADAVAVAGARRRVAPQQPGGRLADHAVVSALAFGRACPPMWWWCDASIILQQGKNLVRRPWPRGLHSGSGPRGPGSAIQGRARVPPRNPAPPFSVENPARTRSHPRYRLFKN